MKSKLSTDIRQNGDVSLFMRTDENTFGLRLWKPYYGEYQAPRHQKALLDEDIVVFPTDIVREYVPKDGVWTEGVRSQELLSSCFSVSRRQAEARFDIIQLVSVFVVRQGLSYLTYKRSRRLPEQRLHGSYSLAFGGHLNPEDVSPLLDIFVPELGLPLLQRELSEELIVEHQPHFRYRGLLYDTSREISSQHLGIVYDVFLSSSTYEIGERGFLIDPRLETAQDINARLDAFENWSVMLLEDDLRRSRQP
jgi:predicted NUDIX family phosphoesterase